MVPMEYTRSHDPDHERRPTPSQDLANVSHDGRRDVEPDGPRSPLGRPA